MATIIIYALCALTAALCAGLLLYSYQLRRYKLLLWSGLCFAGLTVNNILLIVDKVLLPLLVDLSVWRSVSALVAMAVLLYGLVWDAE